MKPSTMLIPALLGGLTLIACRDDVAGLGASQSEGRAAALSLQGAGGSVVDVSGDWNWSDVSHLTLPVFVAELTGIEPEGPITHARCEAAGTMTLTQTGTSFGGVAMTNFQQCVTLGGQVFSSPDAGLPKAVGDGRIRGASVRFSFSNVVVTPCPYHAVISGVQDGVARALRGGGRCVVPGHPQSESPVMLDPPPGGTSKTLRWVAVRP